MNTIEEDGPKAGGRRRRRHSAEFKAKVVAACKHPGVSMASVAMAHGINANLLRRWVMAEPPAGQAAVDCAPAFVAVPMPRGTMSPQPEIRIEVRKGQTTVNIIWPVHAAGDCGVWLRELLQ